MIASLPPMLAMALATGEPSRLHEQLSAEWLPAKALLPLGLSCVGAVTISFFGWRSRAICSATGYTVLGVANKLLSILGSALLTDKPLSAAGAACLVSCLVLAALYRPGPLRKRAHQA